MTQSLDYPGSLPGLDTDGLNEEQAELARSTVEWLSGGSPAGQDALLHRLHREYPAAKAVWKFLNSRSGQVVQQDRASAFNQATRNLCW